jgi:hypothetical protein
LLQETAKTESAIITNAFFIFLNSIFLSMKDKNIKNSIGLT